MRRLVHYALLAALTLAAYGGDDAVEERIIDPVEVDPPLVGTWTTTGTDEDFGAVDVIMELLRDLQDAHYIQLPLFLLYLFS